MRNLILAIFCLINMPLYLLNPCFAQDQKKPELEEFITWKSKFSLDERFRYEYKYNFDFKDSVNDNANIFFNRLKLNADFSLSDEYLNNIAKIFIEGLALDADSYKRKIHSTTSGQRDVLDLHQAYVAINYIAGSDFNVKVGRQEMKYGKCRLIAAPVWANKIRAFDAGVLRYENEVFYGDLLYGEDVKYDDRNLNRSTGGEY